MDNLITLSDIRERQDSLGLPGHYLSLSVTVVSLGLAAAAAAATNLIAHLPGPGRNLSIAWNFSVLWLLLAGGVLGVIVGYGGPMVGAFALPVAIPEVEDLIPPLLLGISEFLFFAPFADITSSASHIGSALTIWFLATCGYGVSAFVIILRARFLYAKSRIRYDDEVAPALNSYIAYMTASLSGPAMLVVLAVLGQLSWWVLNNKVAVIIVLSLIVANYVSGLWFHNVQARPWQALLGDEREPDAPQFMRRYINPIRTRIEAGELDGRYFLPPSRLKPLRARLFRVLQKRASRRRDLERQGQ